MMSAITVRRGSPSAEMEQRAPTRPNHKLMLPHIPHMVNKEGVHRYSNLGGCTT